MKGFFGMGVILVLIVCLSCESRSEDSQEGTERVLGLVDTPTAYLYPKGEYGISLRVYDEGSLLTRFILSLTDYIMLGVPLDIRHFVGDREIEMELPPVIWAKIKLTKKGAGLPVAIGYDPTNYGEDEDENRRVRGIYLVATKPAYLRNIPIEWHLGANADLEDSDKKGICLFGGLDLSINPYLLLYSELDGVNFKGDKALLNLGLRYLASEHLELDFDLRDVQSTNPDRFIRFEYSNRLF